MQKYRPTFYLTINSLFILFILILGGVLAWHSFRDTKEIILFKTNQDYGKIAESFSNDIEATYQPVFETVRLLSSTGIMTASSFEERLGQLPILSVAVDNLEEISALQVGYQNGDYFLIRALRSQKNKALFSAPDNAKFIVDHITHNALLDTQELERIFYTQTLQEIYRQPPVKTEFKTRQRPWYLRAIQTDRVVGVDPYLFYFSRVLGTTISYHKEGTGAVIAADVTLHQVSSTLKKFLLTPNSEIALLTSKGVVLGYSKMQNTIIDQGNDDIKIAELGDLGSSIFSHIYDNNLLKKGTINFSFNNQEWHGACQPFRLFGAQSSELLLVMLSPHDELLADTLNMTQNSLLITLAILLISIPCASFMAKKISHALTNLSKETETVSRLDFEKSITQRSRIKEIDELSRAMDLMKNTISRFLSLLKSLAREQNFDDMLAKITEETLNISHSQAALIWFLDDLSGVLNPVTFSSPNECHINLQNLPSYPIDGDGFIAKAAHEDKACQFELSSQKHPEFAELFHNLNTDIFLLTIFPLKNRKSEEMGVLCLLNKPDDVSDHARSSGQKIDFIRAFSGFASVSLESRYLLLMQKRLMDSFVHLLAGAIDAKSPYTGGHCQRVPVLAKMIAKAACEDQGQYQEFSLDADGWEALHLAGWLHDCGKVTTPEYVVDKATKLQTIYDRIHEVRTRFEVLKRDATIQCWENIANGGDREQLLSSLEQELNTIDNDFYFVAECNLGDDVVDAEKAERLDSIAKRTWTRTLDDKIGISWEELKRKAREPDTSLPVKEYVLADRPDHLVQRDENEQMPEDNPWGFKIKMPEFRYNLGELYNLKVERGTLTSEERYKINDHVIQTIIMLEKLPYPKHLRSVPAIAGSHHETMDGQGYPKKLNAEQMSLTARMMAIADIFEALTASDRPYKKAKKLSEAIKVMHFFKEKNHIDPDLFNLFLSSGVYKEYAVKYLEPEQLDDVDIALYL